MSIEVLIQANTDALKALTAALLSQTTAAAQVAPVAPVAAPVQVAPPAAPVAAPVFTQSAAPAGVPFTDVFGAVEYMKAAYAAITAVNPSLAMSGLQGVMASFGMTDMNQLTPDKYAPFAAAIDDLKRQAGV